MYFLALATDYDGTIAQDGLVDAAMIAALERFRETARRVILVTGRELPDLKRVFPDLKLFDRVVAENGGLLYDPASETERVLAPSPPDALVARLRKHDIAPLSVGQSIVATREPHEKAALAAIQELGLEYQIIFNKGAVMLLPSGVNKATGLAAAIAELGLSAHNVVGVGDAENDHAFMRACGCSAAVANALPTVKESADIRLAGENGAGVAELIERIVREDGELLPPERHGIRIGTAARGEEILLQPHRGGCLIAGSSGIGKSTMATALVEQMIAKGFEICIFDPEGEYHHLEEAVSVGDVRTPPRAEEALKLLKQIGASIAINTQNFQLPERPTFFAKLLPQIAALRAKTGRPHWLLIEEAHHLLPASRTDAAQVIPDELPATIFVTVHPEAVSTDALRTVRTVIALGREAPDVVARFCAVIGESAPRERPRPSEEQVLVWVRGAGLPPRLVKPERPRGAHKRHTRKYAEGELAPDSSFYFRGPDGAMNLRAKNLMIFVEMANGIDDATWEHHLRSGDYSRWFASAIKDEALAAEADEIENDKALDSRESRKRIVEAVTRRYTAPARVSDE